MNQDNLLDIASFSPDLLERPSGWLGHLPFAGWVIREISPQIFVELGTHHGHSFFAFCKAVKEYGLTTKCYAVDTWQGDEHAGLYNDEIFDQVSFFNREKYADFSNLMRMTFDDAASYFANESIELLHIDGFHTYEVVRNDFETWLPKLAPGAVVMFHDPNVRERNFGVWKLWGELQEIYPHNMEFTHSHGLGVLQLNDAPDNKKLPWLDSNYPGKQQLMKYFAAMGSQQLVGFELKELKKQISNPNQVIIERDAEIVGLTQSLIHLEDQSREKSLKLEKLQKEREATLDEIIKAKTINSRMGNVDEVTSNEINNLRLIVEEHEQKLTDSRNYVNVLLSSHSWRLTAPFRWGRLVAARFLKGEYYLSSRIVRFTYHKAPISAENRKSIKEWGFTYMPLVFRRTRSYDVWKEKVEKLKRKINFEERKDPRVTVIIPVYGEVEYTKSCLISIHSAADKCKYEIIIIDDCSPDDTQNVLKSVNGIRVIKNDKNLGFIRSCNRGANEARGEYLLFLNNDTEVHDGWLDELISTFDKVPLTGLVGSKLINLDGSLQEAGGIIWADATGWNYGRGDDPSKPEYNYLREVDYCSGASIMVPKKIFNNLGKFDERYLPAYYEDTDLAFSVQQAGLKVLYQPASRVIHFDGITSGNDLTSGVKSYQVKNRTKFYNKWKERLITHANPGEDVFAQRDRNVCGHILIVDAITPTPDLDSGSLDVFFFLKIFIDLGYRVTFVPDNLHYVDGYTLALQKIGVECLYLPFIESIERYLQEHGREFDFVFLYRAWIANSHFKDVRRFCPQARIIFDTVDLHYLREEREAVIKGSEELASQAKLTKEIEFKLMREADVTIILSKAEVQMLKKIDSSLRLECIPYVREIPGCKNTFSNRRDIVFIGGFDHTPNVDAVEYFVKEIWPIVRQTLSSVNFYIIGSKMPDRVKELEQHEGVVAVGFVKDLADFFDACRLTVVPLRFGAGIKGKIGTSASYGVPSVATTIAIEGMGMIDGKHILVADDANTFAKKVIELYGDETLWTKLSLESLALVDVLYSYKAGKRRLNTLLSSFNTGYQNDLEVSSISSLEAFKD